MSIKYGFFNSLDGDRRYEADDLNNVIKMMVCDGIYPMPDECLQVIAHSKYTLRICAGSAIVLSHYFNSSTVTEIECDPPDSQPRIDRIVVRLDIDEREIRFDIVKGTPNAVPNVPNIVRNGKIWDLCLANVLVSGEVGGITNAQITDTRPDETVCGIITGLVRSNGYIDAYFRQIKQNCERIETRLNALKLAEGESF